MATEVVEYKLIKRDLRRFINRRIYRNMNIIDDSYNDKYQALSLKGDNAKWYINRIVPILEKTIDRLHLDGDTTATAILSKIYNNFRVFRQIKSNWSIDGWEGEKPTFDKLLSFDVDKNTGLMTYGELKSFVDRIRYCKDFSKEEVDKYFRDWINNPSKLTISDYVTMLKLSNREAMSHVDSQKLEDIPDSELKITIPKKGIIRVSIYQYNPGNAMEFVEVDFDDIIVEEEPKILLFKKRNIAIFREKSWIKLDKKLENLFRNLMINDADFIKKQIEELLFREYDMEDASKIIKNVRVISVALKTPYNKVDRDLMPEVRLDDKKEYSMFIRININNEDTIKYVIVGE